MSDLTAHIRRLVDSGADPMIAADVCAAVFLAGVLCAPMRHGDVTVTSRNVTPGAERTRKWRAKRNEIKVSAEANDAAGSSIASVTGDVTKRHAVTPEPLILTSLSSEISTDKGRKKESKARARGTRITRDAALSPDGRAYAESKRLRDIDEAWDEFVDYWINIPGVRGEKLDWEATWRRWVRNIAPGGKYAKPETHHAEPRGLSAVAREYAERAAELARGSSLRDGDGGPAIRVVSGGKGE